ncbi:MAG: HlyD family efflux transporter periplasmic adaptor subunit [Thiomicrorhabdus sp.]|nr:HlyD family efflux transporter periplasmic adaptor subunit [Thiomicrorhabdus sp.]
MMHIKNKVSGFLCLGFCLFPSVLFAQSMEARAVVKAVDRAVLSGELVSTVVSVPKKMGDSFRKGQILVRLDCRVYEAQLSKVQSEVKLADLKLKNAKKLNELRSIGALEVALSEAELEKARAEMQIARINAQRCYIKAPYDGKVVKVLVNEQERAGQEPLIEVIGTKRLQAEIIIPGKWVKNIKLNQKVNLSIDETGETVEAKVTGLNPTIDGVSQTLEVRAELLQTKGIVAGMSATAVFDAPKSMP